jgi:hypothetical protein
MRVAVFIHYYSYLTLASHLFKKNSPSKILASVDNTAENDEV